MELFSVVVLANALDTTVPHTVPRLLTESFEDALLSARSLEVRKSPFVASVTIYKLKVGKMYQKESLKFNDLMKTPPPDYPIIMISWKDHNGKWREHWMCPTCGIAMEIAFHCGAGPMAEDPQAWVCTQKDCRQSSIEEA